MIDLNTVESPPQNLDELHQILLDFHGRVVRISELKLQGKSSTIVSKRGERSQILHGLTATHQDVTGVILGLHLKKRDKDTTGGFYAMLTVILQGQDPLAIYRMESFRIAVRQDGDGWSVIHEGSKYSSFESRNEVSFEEHDVLPLSE